jgi:hypothetical protein
MMDRAELQKKRARLRELAQIAGKCAEAGTAMSAAELTELVAGVTAGYAREDEAGDEPEVSP